MNFGPANRKSTPEIGGVLLREIGPFFRQIVQSEDCRNGAYRDARAAVDAFDRIDVEHGFVSEAGIVLFGVDAVDGASVDASRVLCADAWFRNYVCHMCWKPPSYHTSLVRATCVSYTNQTR